MIAISIGKAKIQDGNFKLIHIIDLEKYQKFINELNSILETQVGKSHPLFFYLKHETLQMQDLLNNFKPHKIKRSLNFIGSTWKWIAGNPDHDDFEIISNKINDVLKNNNRQVIINQLYNERINNITKMTNEILNAIKRENSINDQLTLSIQYKLKLIKEELINVRYAVHWAKLGIINSMVLSKSDVEFATNILDKEKLPYATPEEALDFADVKIMTNNSHLFYIVNIPMTLENTYEKLLIRPVKRNNVINEILYDKILENNEKFYGIVNDCKTFNYLSVCNQNNIVDISNSTCIPNLLRSFNSTCNKANNQHVPTVDEISEGMLLLNQYCGTIQIENTLHYLNGTFLIKFHNTTVKVNDRLFISKEVSTFQALPPILQLTPQEKEFRELLSLEMMKEIHINNTNTIELLRNEKYIHQSVSYGLVITIAVILSIILTLKFINRENTKIIVQKRNVETTKGNPSSSKKVTDQQETEMVTENQDIISGQNSKTSSQPNLTQYQKPSRRKFYETPFF